MKKQILYFCTVLTALTLAQSAFAQDQNLISLESYARIGRGKSKVGTRLNITDAEINSPKSVRFSADAKKIYINSLEGGLTVVYSWPELKKQKTIVHRFDASNAHLFQGENNIYDYKYYTKPPTGDVNNFVGKPVESELSADGRYLWVPYYRRDWDGSGQSPSAIAIIDTQSDEIVRVMPTGPIPKYVTASPDGRFVAVMNWGDNTVGLIDTSSGDPRRYQYVAHMTVEKQLSQEGLAGTDRDATCGFCLRGAVFTPDSRYLVVARMGKGGIAGFHIPSKKYLGSIMNISSTPRHLVLSPDGQTIYASSNYSGEISKTSLVGIINTFNSADGKRVQGPKWKTAFVGKGARTLDISPKGKYLFVAVNISSELVTVDAETLQVLSRIDVDPYAVGLAVAPDLSAAVLTSQGHDGAGGGNAVTIIRIRANESDSKIPMALN
ncbi:MAG: beta-propeller fold lactonase family protein [Bdellovibrionaceae bacterium]|nr:beta-propeller fold lactonase family protein [Pseudobdellovibrionaceae bacterium]